MFKLEFETTGAAFADEGAFEVCAVLRRIAERVQLEADGGSREGEGPIRDSNGNTIGRWLYEINEEEDTAKADAQARWLELEDRDQLDLY